MRVETIEQLAELLALNVPCWIKEGVTGQIYVDGVNADEGLVTLKPYGWSEQRFSVKFTDVPIHADDRYILGADNPLPATNWARHPDGSFTYDRFGIKWRETWAGVDVADNQPRVTITLPQPFLDLCEERGVLPAEVLCGLVGDLCGIEDGSVFQNHGSDERRLAREWFNRVMWRVE